MSRIVRGESADIRGMKTNPMPSEGARSHLGIKFRSVASEGYLTEEEVAERMQASRQEGYREAEQRLAAPIQTVVEHLERVVDELSQFRRDLFRESENDILKMITMIAKRVVHAELQVKPELLHGVIEKALSILEKQKKIVLLFNQEDLQRVAQTKAGLVEKFKGIEELVLEVDSQLPIGHVIAKTKVMELDLSPEGIVDHLLSQLYQKKNEITSTNAEGDTV